MNQENIRFLREDYIMYIESIKKDSQTFACESLYLFIQM